MKLLVVLDFNGTLLDSTHRSRAGVRHDAMARAKYVYFRPHLRDFVAWLMTVPDIDVGLWTSNIAPNAHALADVVFTPAEKARLAFVFSRTECLVYADYSSQKPVQRLFNTGCYTPSYTIFVDDSPEKILYPKSSSEFYYRIPTFVASTTAGGDDALLHLRTEIERRLCEKNNLNIVQSHHGAP